MNLYKKLIRPILFKIDPETAHHLILRSLPVARACGAISVAKALFSSKAASPEPVKVAGLTFQNRIGLAAGFDKEALAVDLFSALGFGHLELGTVTAVPQPGNPRPRIFRFPKDDALVNRMGFPSAGAEVVARRLDAIRSSGAQLPVIGVNIGKSKDVPLEAADNDYQTSMRAVAPYADYIAINVSSPNTKDLRQLQERGRLEQLLNSLQSVNASHRPIFVKIAPDLTHAQIDDVIEACLAGGVAGIIGTNTTLSREGLQVPTAEVGGMSGRPLHTKAVEIVKYLCDRVQNRMAIIGVGGISTARDAQDMLDAGAALVQIYTALVFEGPTIVRDIHSGICDLTAAASPEKGASDPIEETSRSLEDLG